MAIMNASAAMATRIVRMAVHWLPSVQLRMALLDRIFRRYLAWRPFEAIARTRDGSQMKVSFPDQIQTNIYMFGVWEPNATEYLKSQLKPGDIFVDVGANIGYFSLLASRLVGASGKVISIEASPTIAKALSENVQRNALTNVQVIRAAVSDRRKSIDIFLAGSSNLGASTTVPSVAQRKQQKLEARIQAFPLGDLVPAEILRRARLIKVDVEGAEADVFEGVRDLLPQLENTEWLFELTPEAADEQGRDVESIMKIFCDAGYRLFRIENSYDWRAYIDPPYKVLDELKAVPSSQIDVIASKRMRASRGEF